MIRVIDATYVISRMSRPDNRLKFVDATDVRSFDRYRIDSAVLLPPDRVQSHAAQYLPSTGTELIVYGESEADPSAMETARELEKLGYLNVFVYPGGKDEWRKASLGLQTLSPPLYPQLMNFIPPKAA